MKEDALQLAKIAVFRGMPRDELAALERRCQMLEPRDGTEVFSQGDPADAVYAIVGGSGRVRIGAADHRGKGLMVEMFKAGEIFGEIGAMDDGVRTATAVAEGQLRLLRMSAEAFRTALRTSPAVGEALSRSLAERLRRTFQLFQDASFENLELRLARQVLYLAGRDSRANPNGIQLARRFRQGELADLLGATTRSIITLLNAWRAAGYVSYDTDRALLTITDPGALRAIVEGANTSLSAPSGGGEGIRRPTLPSSA